MGDFRNATKAIMRACLKELPKPVVDLGGRGHRVDTAEIIGQDFETRDMMSGRDVGRVVDAMHMRGIPDASLGTIICTSAMEHIENPAAAAYHMARVTKPGGLVFVSVPFKFNYHPQPEDYWRFTVPALRLLFGLNYIETACDWFEPDGCFFFGQRGPEPSEVQALKTMQAIHGLITEAEAGFLFRAAASATPGGDFVELGTYLGRSCSVLCHASARWGRIPWTIDDYSYKNPCSPETTSKNLRRAGLNAHVIRGDSRKVPAEIKTVSMLFVDSLHLPDHFNAECDAWLPLVIKGGVVVCHDYEHTKWHEMKPAIDARFRKWEKVGQETSMIAFRKP